MFRSFCLFIFRITGWTADTNTPPEIKRCIIIAAPHTSNRDFWYAMAAFAIYRLKIRYTIKKEWMRFPFSLITKPLGGIAIDRTPRNGNENRISHTDAMIDLYKNNEELIILITPEGTRSKQEHWKTGFYHIAKGANVPICLGYVNYKDKIAGIAKTIYPADMEKDMKEIMEFYKNCHPKFPEKFSVDTNYL
ncbi:MAG TPA: 1-acyl-sn-glycerol-3-phosphate acyltransferase [Panacibacter sp.]|nr:1-acyl-sn-glycerol-3-phosphate acyltransferase [Panacibacter sp.]